MTGSSKWWWWLLIELIDLIAYLVDISDLNSCIDPLVPGVPSDCLLKTRVEFMLRPENSSTFHTGSSNNLGVVEQTKGQLK